MIRDARFDFRSSRMCGETVMRVNLVKSWSMG